MQWPTLVEKATPNVTSLGVASITKTRHQLRETRWRQTSCVSTGLRHKKPNLFCVLLCFVPSFRHPCLQVYFTYTAETAISLLNECRFKAFPVIFTGIMRIPIRLWLIVPACWLSPHIMSQEETLKLIFKGQWQPVNPILEPHTQDRPVLLLWSWVPDL